MARPDDEAPPPHLGDYPDGAYWSAAPGGGSGDAETGIQEPSVSGDVIRFMWDYGVRVPLWDRSGLLSDEPAWLRAALGISDELIEALRQWGSEMNDMDAVPSGRTSAAEWERAMADLDRRARELVEWLRRELGDRYTVAYRPW